MTGQSHRDAVRSYRERHRAEGLCLTCSEPATRQQRCEKHAEKRNAGRRRREGEKIAAGICVRCKRPAEGGRLHCALHRGHKNALQTIANRARGGLAHPMSCVRCDMIGHTGRGCAGFTEEQKLKLQDDARARLARPVSERKGK